MSLLKKAIKKTIGRKRQLSFCSKVFCLSHILIGIEFSPQTILTHVPYLSKDQSLLPWSVVFSKTPCHTGLRISIRKREVVLRTRIYLAIIGIAALFMWAGLLVGPTVAIIGSLLPSRLSLGKSQLKPSKAE